jgi:hypothetical protein
MKRWGLAALVVAVVLLHQDLWFWKDGRLLLGFLPVGYAYHLGYCLLASLTLWILVRWAWPRGLEEEERPPS